MAETPKSAAEVQLRIDTTGLALEEAAVRVTDLVEERARKVGSRLRRPAGSMKIKP